MYRLAVNLTYTEAEDCDVMTGEVIFDFEEYMTACTDLWYRMQRIRTHVAEREEKET
jgi:hypothetical protein